MKSVTRRILVQLGLSPKYHGYQAIVEAVDVMNKNPGIKTTATYTIVANKIGSVYSRVERNIRHAVSVVLTRGDLDLMRRIFGYNITPDGTIYPGDFLACLTMYIQEVHSNALEV